MIAGWKGHVSFEKIKLLRCKVGVGGFWSSVAIIAVFGWSRLWFDALLPDGVVGSRVCMRESATVD